MMEASTPHESAVSSTMAEEKGAKPSVKEREDAATAIDPASPNRFTNRELSWLAFNERVFEEAGNAAYPLFERIRFLSISANNLNEFFMVRVAGLKGQIDAGIDLPSQDGLTPSNQLRLILDRAATLMHAQQDCWRRLSADLHEMGITVIQNKADFRENELTWLGSYFIDRLFPIVTPIAIDPAHPFPFLPNLGFAMVLTLKRRNEREPLRALVPLPQMINRFVRLPGTEARFVTLETIIELHIGQMFPRFNVTEVGLCRVLRDSDIEIEEEAEDLVRLYESALKQRRRGNVIRLSINDTMSEDMRSFLIGHLDAAPETVF